MVSIAEKRATTKCQKNEIIWNHITIVSDLLPIASFSNAHPPLNMIVCHKTCRTLEHKKNK